MSDPFFIVECVGVVAFAISGATLAIRKGMDLFGVNVLGLATGVGGGCLRAIVRGICPPHMLRDPAFALISITRARCSSRCSTSTPASPRANAQRVPLTLLYTDAVGLVCSPPAAWTPRYAPTPRDRRFCSCSWRF